MGAVKQGQEKAHGEKTPRRGIPTSNRGLLEEKPMASVNVMDLVFSFVNATHHEIGSPTSCLITTAKQYPQEMQDAIERFAKSWHRLKDLNSVVNDILEPKESHLTEEEIKELQAGECKCANLEALKPLLLAETKKLIEILNDLDALRKKYPNIDHAGEVALDALISNVKPLFILLEKLLEEDDPNEEIAQRIDSMSKKRLFTAILTLAIIHGFGTFGTNYDKKLEGTIIRCNEVIRNLIFSNIIVNAKRATEQSEDAKLQINIFKKDDYVVFEFKDNGCGMSEESMNKLNFGERVTTKQEPGEHGIGFQYCRELAQKMSGRLYVKQSEIGKGTTVVFEALIIEDEIEACSTKK
jgi:signal transduction histidine kinase